MRDKFSMINDDNYYEFMVDIGEEVVRRVLSPLADIYTAVYTPVPAPNYLAYNLMSVSMFYDTKYSKLYVTYKLDEDRLLSVRQYDSRIYRSINKNIETVQRDEDILVEVVGEPISKPEYGRQYSLGDMVVYRPIKVDTEFMWNIIPGPYDKSFPYFVSNVERFKDNIRRNNVSIDKVQEYLNKVVDINKRYIDKTDPDYERGFKKFANAYKRYLNYTPRIVEEWRGFTIYIDVKHDTIAEKLDNPKHDRGHIEHPERIKQYITTWAIAHGKRVK